MIYENQTANKLLEKYNENGTISELFLKDSTLSVLGYDFSLDNPNKRILTIDLSRATLHNKISSINYNFAINTQDGIIEIDEEGKVPIYVLANVGMHLIGFSRFFMILIICELIMLLDNYIKNRRTIKRLLSPLEKLASVTNALNFNMESPDYLRKIEGTLDSINATRLDTRIPLSSAKTELKSGSMSIAWTQKVEQILSCLDRIDAAYHSQMRFVSDASHELRTPIAVIQGYANLLDRWGREDPEAMQEAINAIKSESDSMKEMVEQLLFLARGDNKSMHLKFEAVNVNELAKEIYSQIEMLDKTHRLEGNFQQEESSDSTVIFADTGLIKQLMRILIDNSLKYTPENGAIKISVKREDANVTFSVQDEGIGIPQEALPFIFDRFYRADESRARKTGGTGLGLSISKWIVDKHNGHLEVLTRENIGSRFTVIIPAKAEEDMKSEVNGKI